MKIISIIILLSIYWGNCMQAQSAAYFDPAQAYNKLLLEKNSGEYKLVGTYKVIGTEYLFGEKNEGNVYAKNEQAKNIPISYNTYSQQLDFYQNNNTLTPLVKTCNEVDSFYMHNSTNVVADKGLMFVNGKFIGSAENSFYLVVYRGPFYCLYKRYKSTLSIVSTNYIQSELRQFELQYEYYYTTNTEMELKKIKATLPGLNKVFKAEKINSVSITPDDFETNSEIALVKAFTQANNNHQ